MDAQHNTDETHKMDALGGTHEMDAQHNTDETHKMDTLGGTHEMDAQHNTDETLKGVNEVKGVNGVKGVVSMCKHSYRTGLFSEVLSCTSVRFAHLLRNYRELFLMN